MTSPPDGRRSGYRRFAASASLGVLELVLAAALAAPPPSINTADAATLAAAGESLYRTGTRRDGSALEAIVRNDVAISPNTVTCEGCHRRSGLGTSEGRIRTPPITGTVLFDARTAPDPRPAYDARALRRALVEGIGADGQSLDPLMPRYRLRDADVAALQAYLRYLGSDAAPGVTDTDIRLVTIVAKSTPARQRAALQQVIERYVQNKNAGSRREAARAAAARRHAFGDRRDRAFRRWTWTVWELTGDDADWPAQLESLYAQAPPFAVLSGATGHSWVTVSRFCERKALPCVLPITDVAATGTSDFYTLYFSAATELEARVAARDLTGDTSIRSDRLLLLYTDDDKGRAAAKSWREALVPSSTQAIAVRSVPTGHVPATAEWQSLLERERPDVLMAWLPDAALTTLADASRGTKSLPMRIYTLASFAAWADADVPSPLRSRLRHIYPYRLPQSGRSQFPREQVWLKGQGFENLERETAVRALFACHALGEGLADIGANFSRDYLLESLEHVLDGTEMNTIFPHTTLGPGQRYLSRGAYVTELSPRGATDPFARAEWIQP